MKRESALNFLGILLVITGGLSTLMIFGSAIQFVQVQNEEIISVLIKLKGTEVAFGYSLYGFKFFKFNFIATLTYIMPIVAGSFAIVAAFKKNSKFFVISTVLFFISLLMFILLPVFSLLSTTNELDLLLQYYEYQVIYDDGSIYAMLFTLIGIIFGIITWAYCIHSKKESEKINADYCTKAAYCYLAKGDQKNFYITKGYVSVLRQVLLTSVTFGIWHFIWVYRTTKLLSETTNSKKHNPVAQLLLCIFVPLYFIFWTFMQATKVDELAEDNGITSNIAFMSMFLAPFPLLMQNKINDIARKLAREVMKDETEFSQSIGNVFSAQDELNRENIATPQAVTNVDNVTNVETVFNVETVANVETVSNESQEG